MKNKTCSPVVAVILFFAFALFLYSSWKLIEIADEYIKAEEKYEDLSETYVRDRTGLIPDDETRKADGSPEEEGEPAAESDTSVFLTPASYECDPAEDAPVPVAVDWAGLKARNPEIVGWIYLEGFPECSYPVMHAADNETYLHADFDRNYLYAGSIFLDCENKGDFSDPSSIVYGHNMKNGSMFACLKKLKEQGTYDSAPYFWILTEQGSFRYHIFSVFDTLPTGPVYSLWEGGGENFLQWERQIQQLSLVGNDVRLTEADHTVILSTCTPDHDHRTVVVGKCCSTQKPGR